MRLLNLLVFLAVVPAFSAQKLSEDELIYTDWVCLNSNKIYNGYLADTIRLMDDAYTPEGLSTASLWNFVFEEEGSFNIYTVDLASAASRLEVTLPDSIFEAVDADSLLQTVTTSNLLTNFSWVTGRKCIRFERASDPSDVLLIQRSGESWTKLADNATGIYVENLETDYTDWRLDRRKRQLILHLHNNPDNAYIYGIKRVSESEILLIREGWTLR